jgi:hypothetical protein
MADSEKPPARLVARAEEIVHARSGPLSYYDKLNWWTDESRLWWFKYYTGLLEDLGKPAFPHTKYAGFQVGRAMDSWGIHAGPLFDLSETIALHLRRFRSAAEEPDD